MKFKIDIKKGIYNKTISVDGVRHEVDTSKEFVYYEVNMAKVYFLEEENKEELKRQLKEDLQEIVKALDEKEIER